MGVAGTGRKEFLRLLEEDEEFRLAVAAKIGLLEILQKLEQYDRKFNEMLERMYRHEIEIKKIRENLRNMIVSSTRSLGS